MGLSNNVIMWTIFGVVVTTMMVLDLGVFNRKAHEVRLKEALMFSAMWIGLGLGFCGFVYYELGRDGAMQYLTGYLLEESLSVDNLFVFVLIFSYFKVSGRYQHRVLFWGILGAIVMRGLFIFTGVALIRMFDWIIYVFGAFLLFTGFKMAFSGDNDIHVDKNPVLNLLKKTGRVTHGYRENHFFVRENGKIFMTPLFVVLMLVESSDIVFAMDSVPAILAISDNPFIIYTSNIFAILGLRSLYFALAGVIQMFKYLHYGLSLVLIFIGVKMLISNYYHIPIQYALGVLAVLITGSILASVLHKPKENNSKE